MVANWRFQINPQINMQCYFYFAPDVAAVAAIAAIAETGASLSFLLVGVGWCCCCYCHCHTAT